MSCAIHHLIYDMEGRKELRVMAMVNDVAVGFCAVANYGKPVTTLYQVFVCKEWRGCGIGTVMVDEACRIAKEAGATSVSAVVFEDGPAEWWAKRGFSPVHLEQGRMIVSKPTEFALMETPTMMRNDLCQKP